MPLGLPALKCPSSNQIQMTNAHCLLPPHISSSWQPCLYRLLLVRLLLSTPRVPCFKPDYCPVGHTATASSLPLGSFCSHISAGTGCLHVYVTSPKYLVPPQGALVACLRIGIWPRPGPWHWVGGVNMTRSQQREGLSPLLLSEV